MRNAEEELDAQIANLLEKKKKLTLMKGVGVEQDQDGNVGSAQEETGEVDFEKQKFSKKKMLISKMLKES